MSTDEYSRSAALAKIAEHYGAEKQLIKAVEELSELTTELAKANTALMLGGTKKAAAYRGNIICELADVENMLDQIKVLINCADEVEEERDHKIKRQLRRIKAEQD